MFRAQRPSRPTRPPPGVRLNLEPLEDRRAPAVLSYTAPSKNGPDLIEVRLDATGKNVEIYDNGKRVAQQSLSKVDSVAIYGAANEPDIVRVQSSAAGFFPRPVSFDGGAGGPDTLEVIGNGATSAVYQPNGLPPGNGTVTVDGVAVTFTGLEPAPEAAGGKPLAVSNMAGLTLDYSAFPTGITADIGTSSTLVTYVGSGGALQVVQITGQVTTVKGTVFDDTYIDHTSVPLLTLIDPGGNDTYVFDPGSTILVSDAGGNDTLDFSPDSLPINGTITHNTTTVTNPIGSVIFTGTAEAVIGTTGNDVYAVIPGSTFTITDPGGNDTLDLSGASTAIIATIDHTGQTITDAGGNQVIFSGVTDGDTLVGTSGGDTYHVVPGSTFTIADAGGNDTLDLSGSNTAIIATVDHNGASVSNAAGTVIFSGVTDGDSLVGTVGDDIYAVVPGSTYTITDVGGNDTLDFSSSSQAIVATIETNSTTVTDPDGLVLFHGTVSTVIGTAGDDLLIDPAEQALTLVGLGGNDTYDLDPRGKVTIVETGAGKDTVRFDRFPGRIDGSLATGKFTATNGNNKYEVAVASGQLTNFVGAPGGNNVAGNAADNTFVLGPGDSTVDGGAGDDTYIIVPGGGGQYVVYDGAGFDTVDLSRSPVGVNVDLSLTGTAQKLTAANARLTLNGVFEVAIGSQHADVLSGAPWNTILIGLGGNDQLNGQVGNTVMVGGDGDDILNGGSGRDVAIGGSGADRIKGGSGEDILIAGFTVYDTDIPALNAIRGVWVTSDPYATRVQTLRSYLIAGVTVTNDDGAVDSLTGGQGLDWYFLQTSGPFADVVTDKNKDEFIN